MNIFRDLIFLYIAFILPYFIVFGGLAIIPMPKLIEPIASHFNGVVVIFGLYLLTQYILIYLYRKFTDDKEY